VVKSWIRDIIRRGQTLLQLSGGEPALRDDLPEIVAFAKESSCGYVQLNTNGVRLAEDRQFVKELAQAGLSFAFMQFDGMDDEVYRRLRGRDLLEIKKQAIANCSENNIGVVLVPTIVPGVNTGQIGAILRFAAGSSPAVRGVHYQPVCYMGRIPREPADKDRFTLDELAVALVEQSGGLISIGDIKPSRCDHPLCGFHADYLADPDGSLRPLSGATGEAVEEPHTAEKSRDFVARRWERPAREPVEAGCCCGCADEIPKVQSCCESLDDFLLRVRTYGFTVTAMAFQDVWNIDLERLRQCSLHVYREGRMVPFCANYLGDLP
jgi:uncharacterized radical SAM superfamily Fe-S cluster-containing enzyme